MVKFIKTTKIFKAVKKHKKPLIILACAATVATVIYTDVFNLGTQTPVSDYLYTSDSAGQNTKILGEATLVDADGTDLVQDDSFFVNAILNKEKSRDEALETLQVVVDSAETLPDVKDKALTEIMQIASDIETETTIEEMIKAKGFEDCIAIISGQNINVIVKSDGLITSDIAQITDIVKNETGFSAENIRIVDKA
ncbi:MAG: SpoIIIAH-like family protein [Clostridia bacterium]|nr:SpoIIIAH-like family protein [Clostridia bacterium]